MKIGNLKIINTNREHYHHLDLVYAHLPQQLKELKLQVMLLICSLLQ